MRKFRNIMLPLNMLIIINISAFLLLYFYEKLFDWRLPLTGLLINAMVITAYLIIVRKRLGDEYLFLIVGMLVSLGVITIFRLDRDLGLKQIIWLVLGVGLFFLSYYLYSKFSFWDKIILYYPAISLGLFVITMVFGSDIKGANNWIVIFGFNFQPSELIRILFVFFLAAYYKSPQSLEINKLSLLGKQLVIRGKQVAIHGKIVMLLIAYGFMGFMILQREWGTTLLLFTVHFMLFYTFDGSVKLMVLNAAAAIAGGTFGYLLLYHIRVRFETWLNPWADIAGKGYQITQSLFAIGSGGFFGTGIGLGSPDLIPEVHTDFIFSAICEEMGIFGGASVVLLYFLLVYRGIKVSLGVNDVFQKVLALGITVMLGIQSFIIIGGVIKLIPLTGITLPFISYGGSSLTTSFIALGILQAISQKTHVKWEDVAVEDK